MSTMMKYLKLIYNYFMAEKHIEVHVSGHQSKLNWLRASVLGANDGIVSIAGLVLGLAGATNSSVIIFTAGLAGIIAGSISMAVGEYVSVSSSRDTEKALLKKERYELEHHPEAELEELTAIYKSKGLSEDTAKLVANELTEHDAVAAHFDAELRIDPEHLTSPWHAAFASALSFLVGAIIPLLAISIPPADIRVPFAFISVIIALVVTGIFSAVAGGANVKKAVVRVVIGGILAMTVTYIIGRIFMISRLI